MGAITQRIPKPIIPIGSKPAIFHIIDNVLQAGIHNFIIIIGHLGEQIVQTIKKAYPKYNIQFIQQKEMLGLGHAVYQTKSYFQNTDKMLLIYGDTLFEVSGNLKQHCKRENSWLGLYPIENPQSYGVAQLDKNEKNIIRLYEKPKNPVSNLTISGVNYFTKPQYLFEALEYIISNNIQTKKEFQVTDAYDYMIRKMNIVIEPMYLKAWHDVGTIESILLTNQILLKKNPHRSFRASIKKSTVSPHVYIANGTRISNSRIENYTSIGENTLIQNSTISNSIIQENAAIQNSNIKDSFIGSSANVENFKGSCILGYKASVKIWVS